MIAFSFLGGLFHFMQSPPKRAMHKADDDRKDNTKYTSLREADKHKHQLRDGNEAEACEDAGC
jgi:hypothetical protein